MALKIISVICFTIIAMRHMFELKSEKANEILNGVSFVAVLALAFCFGRLAQ